MREAPCISTCLPSTHPPTPPTWSAFHRAACLQYGFPALTILFSFAGFYVQEMADESTAKLYSGLLGVGDEILEVNGAKVAGLGLAHVRELLAHAESLSIRVLRHRPVPR